MVTDLLITDQVWEWYLLSYIGPCNANEEFTCFNSSDCIPRNGRCNGVPECSQLEDEIYCCQDHLFGCYVDASDSFYALGGNANRHYYECLDKMALCDNHVDCVDGSDENPVNCKCSLLLLSFGGHLAGSSWYNVISTEFQKGKSTDYTQQSLCYTLYTLKACYLCIYGG